MNVSRSKRVRKGGFRSFRGFVAPGLSAFVADRFNSARDALPFDPAMWSVDALQSIQRTPLAKTGHAERDMIFVEWALKCRNEVGSGAVRDLTTP